MKTIPRPFVTLAAVCAAAWCGLAAQPACAAEAPAAGPAAAAPADPYAGLAAMDFGSDRAAAAAVEAQVRAAAPAGYAAIEQKILAVLADRRPRAPRSNSAAASCASPVPTPASRRWPRCWATRSSRTWRATRWRTSPPRR